MIRRFRAAAAMVAVASAVAVTACVSDDTDADASTWLFVQTAESAQLAGSTLVMPVEREIFGFTDRPARDHAYLDASGFVTLWDENLEGGFAADPPNAVLTWNDNGQISEAELVLTDAALMDDGSQIAYSISVEAGSPPDGDVGAVSLFVDASMAIQTMQYQRKLYKGGYLDSGTTTVPESDGSSQEPGE